MKANEAPEKIYFDGENKACKLPVFSSQNIEYTRTDAFIKKACEWLKNHYRYYMFNPTGKRLEAFFGGDMCNDFEDYMKGE